MADAVSTQVLLNGTVYYTVHLTNLSDGTGESAVKKIDITALIGPNRLAPRALSLVEAKGAITGMAVKLYSNFGTGVKPFLIAAGSPLHICLVNEGGIPDVGSGTNDGSLMLTTVGAASGSTYDLTLTFRLLP